MEANQWRWSYEIMALKLNDGLYVLSNTREFDWVIQLLAVAYCDNELYELFIKNEIHNNVLWQLVFVLLRDGVTVQTYKKKATI